MIYFEDAGRIEVSTISTLCLSPSTFSLNSLSDDFRLRKKFGTLTEMARSLQGARWPTKSLPHESWPRVHARTPLISPPESLPWQHPLRSQRLHWLPAASQGTVSTSFPPGVHDLTRGPGDLPMTAQAAAHVHTSSVPHTSLLLAEARRNGPLSQDANLSLCSSDSHHAPGGARGGAGFPSPLHPASLRRGVCVLRLCLLQLLAALIDGGCVTEGGNK